MKEQFIQEAYDIWNNIKSWNDYRLREALDELFTKHGIDNKKAHKKIEQAFFNYMASSSNDSSLFYNPAINYIADKLLYK